jgi:hypothetical protein
VVYLEGPEHLGNTEFDDLTNCVDIGLDTFEIVSSQLHIAGDTAAAASVNMFTTPAEFDLYNFNGFINVVSGQIDIHLSTGPENIARLLPGEYILDTTRRRMIDAAAGLRLTCAQDGTEAFFDNFSLKTILSGGIFMPAAAGFGWIDFDGDTRQFTLPIVDADAATHDARLAEVVALEDAIEAISELNLTRTDFIIERDDTGAGKPTVQAAQVNIEWKVTYVDSTNGDVETLRIGGAKLTLADVLLPGSNVADLSQTEMAAFVTAFEAVVLSSSANAVEVQSVAFLE